MKAHEQKISDLNRYQKSHLIWRLDSKTCVGMLTAGRIAKGEIPDIITLFDAFKFADLSDHAAKIHSKKVMDFSAKNAWKKIWQLYVSESKKDPELDFFEFAHYAIGVRLGKDDALRKLYEEAKKRSERMLKDAKITSG